MKGKIGIFTSEVYPVAANGRFMAVFLPATWMNHALCEIDLERLPPKFIGECT
jgi:hypothetical protein